MGLYVRLFGGFAVEWDGTPVLTLGAPRLQSLLAYLLLHADGNLTRAHVAFIFWPDASEAAARNNLRQALHQLRHDLPQLNGLLHVDAASIYWSPQAAPQVDVNAFRSGLAQAERLRRTGGDWVGALEHIVALYTGDLLPSCYDDWIAPLRDKLKAECDHALQQLVRACMEQRAWPAAIAYAQRWLSLDPLRDEPNLALMELCAEQGDPTAALRVYQTYVETLRRELDAEPAPEAVQLAERLRRRNVNGARQAPANHTVEYPAGHPVEHVAEHAAGPLVGRKREWQALTQAWRRAVAGHALCVVIEGEAGIGKSRLAAELAQWATRQGYAVAQARSYAAEGQLSLGPVASWLRSASLQAALAHFPEPWLSEVARLLPEVLVEHPALPRPAPITEYGQRLRFFEALARLVLLVDRPLLLVLDDVQWCDQETLDWLHFLLRFAAARPLLAVATVRSGELHLDQPFPQLRRQLQQEERLAAIRLEPLDAAESAELAATIAGRRVDEDTALLLYRHTEGNPLFIVETVAAGELPSPPADMTTPLALPPRMQAVIGGRLAQLAPPARALAELAAAIGRAFDVDLLAAANGGSEADTLLALDELWQRRIVREQPGAPTPAAQYDFTHDKLREVAYAETGAPRRRLLHQRIAAALAQLHAADLDPVSAQLAAHYDAAGQVEPAIESYVRAGRIAESLLALDDALRWTLRALELVNWLPTGERRDRNELGLLLALARIWRITRGWAYHGLVEVLERALALCVRVGDPMQRAHVLYGLQSVYIVQARHDRVWQITLQAEDLFRDLVGMEQPKLAWVQLALSLMHNGQFARALEQLGQIDEVNDREAIATFQQVQGVNYLFLAQVNRGQTLWCMGRPDEALQCCLTALEHARALDEPISQVLVATYTAMLHQLRGDAGFLVAARAAGTLATEFKATYYQLWAATLVAYGEALEQPAPAAADRLDAAIAAFRAADAGLRLPYYLALAAQTRLALADGAAASAVLDEAFSVADANNEHWWDAELHRLRGQVAAQQGDLAAAEHACRQALSLAEQQQALALNLRAAMDLAELYCTTGRAAEAVALLQPIYDRFTEGFATADLVQARALLARAPR